MTKLEQVSWTALGIRLLANMIPYISDFNWQDTEVPMPTQDQLIEMSNELEQERQQLLAKKWLEQEQANRERSIF